MKPSNDAKAGPSRWIMIGLAAACAVVTTVAAWQAKAQTAVSSVPTRHAMPYDESADPHRDCRPR